MLGAEAGSTTGELVAIGGFLMAIVGTASVLISRSNDRTTKAVKELEAKLEDRTTKIHDRIDEHMAREEESTRSMTADLTDLRESVAHIAGTLGLPKQAEPSVRRLERPR